MLKAQLDCADKGNTSIRAHPTIPHIHGLHIVDPNNLNGKSVRKKKFHCVFIEYWMDMGFFIIILYKFRALISVLFSSFIGYCV